MSLKPSVIATLLFVVGLLCGPAPPPAYAVGPNHPVNPGGLTLAEALDHAGRHRQELTAFSDDLDAAASTMRHADRPLNPELGVEWDNLGGDSPADEVRETTVSLRQPFEIGGKPLARKNRGQAEILRLQRQRTLVWLDIAAEVREAFVAVQVARARLALHQEAEQIAVELAGLTHERVAAGDLAATEETRAEAGKAETRAETQRLQRLLTEAEQDLTLALAEPELTRVTTTDPLPLEVAIPDRQTMLAMMDAAPLLALRVSESTHAATDLALEQANAWSDPALSLAVREAAGKDGRALTLGLSMPLPLFQRNQVAVAAANAQLRKANRNEAATAHRLRTELLKVHGQLLASDQEARTLRLDALSRAQAAAEAVREGFRFGKFRYSDVLEATNSQVRVKARHLDALLDLNRAAIALDRLLGRPSLPETAADTSSPSHLRSTP
jgi:cobalt-zinc-cadmium efflux system outer membrane protein